jgi:sulfur-carrier protein
MTTRVLYFAWMREKTGRAEEQIDLPEGVETIADLIAWQKSRGPDFAAAFERDEVIRAAIDQEHVAHDAAVRGAREIAFFPPVTGG